MTTPWGPLQPLQAQLQAQEADTTAGPDGDARRKQQDAALARALAGDELTAAVKAASLEQLDLALAHAALGADRRPTALLYLLSSKAAKMEALQQRRLAADTKAQYESSAAKFISQAGVLLAQLPAAAAAKELKRVSHVCAVLAAAADELGLALKAVFPLRALLRRLHQAPGGAVVTPIHGHFFYLCLRAKCYAAAMDALDLPLTEIHPQPHLVDSVDFLRYAYYGGVLLLGEKRFPEAMDFLLLAVTAPALALSAFAIEAYKKLLLAALVADGEAAPLPKYTPFVVSRHLESHCLPYADLVRAFVVKRDVAAARAVVDRHAAVFAKDGNLGLARQCLVALQHRKLLQLTRTYATIELAEMPLAAGIAGANASEDEVAAGAGAGADAGAVVPPVSATDVEKMLLQLIAGGQMDAVIDREKAKVTFVLEDEAAGKDELDSGGDAEIMRRLQREMQKLVFVASRLRDMDAELVTSAKFQGKLAKEKDRRQRLAMHNQQSDEGMEDASIGGMDTSE